MAPIRKIYLLHQTHTDLGYTDHVDALWHHHRDILAAALDLCEATADAPGGAQIKWTCEVTGTTLDFLRHASPRNVDRFLALHRTGRIAVGALRWHWTPLVSPALAARTLKDIDELRDEFGVRIRAAMQCDVNGLAWFWNDLLLARGVDFLLTQQNPHRGYWGDRVPSAWWWENRSGGRLLTLQGEHYGMGGYLNLARAGQQMESDVAEVLARQNASAAWPFDFSVLTMTNTANGDNVFPDQGLSDAVIDWNARHEVPMEIVTLDELAELMHGHAVGLPAQSGEWMDSWVDGVGATPLETAAARSAERLLPAIAAMGADNGPAYDSLIDALALYDEHTWGAHSAATAPDSLFATMQRTAKSAYAYRAHALALRLVATGARKRVTQGPAEGDAGFGPTSSAESPDVQSYLVANPADVPVSVDWPVPFDRGAGPQISIPQAYGTNHFFPGFGDDGWTDRLQPGAPAGTHRIRATLPAKGAQVVRPVVGDTGAASASPGRLQTARAMLGIDLATGALDSWIDTASGTELIGTPTLAPGVQLLDPRFSRRDIFQAPYWERSDLPMGWNAAELWQDDPASVRPGAAFVDAAGAHQDLTFQYGCGIEIAVRWSLPHVSARPQLVAMQRATRVERAFSINWPVRFAGFDRTRIDTGAGLVDADKGHVASSCRAWQSAFRGIVLDNADGRSIALWAPDTPLFQPGGPSTRHPHDGIGPHPGGVFWAVNTHWDTNFPSRVFDPSPFRLSLGLCADATASDVLTELATVPVIVRAPLAGPGDAAGFWPDT